LSPVVAYVHAADADAAAAAEDDDDDVDVDDVDAVYDPSDGGVDAVVARGARGDTFNVGAW
jgi:hypothetical protein